MAKTKLLICPYCGDAQAAGERCRACGGLFEPLSRQATHNAMGPWFVRDTGKPFHPGCSYETLVTMIDRGQVTRTSIIRGPTTKQYWSVARRVPGVAHLLGYCHSCDARVDPADHGCHACGAPFGAYLDRNFLGLPEIRPLPWEARMEDGSLETPATFTSEVPDRPAPAGGLSHFASDDELLDASAAAGATRPAETGAARQWVRPSPGPEASLAGPAATAGDQPTVFDETSSSAITRALRRRLASQQRMIRVLAVVVVVGIVLVLASNLDRLARLAGGGSSDPVPTGSEKAAATVQDSGAEAAIRELDATIAGGPSPVGNPDPGTPEPQGKSASVADLPAAGGDASPPRAAEPAEVDAYARALELIAAAARVDRSLDERIDDYTEALQRLQSLGGSAMAEPQPADLTDLIKHVEEELERLRLKAFFG